MFTKTVTRRGESKAPPDLAVLIDVANTHERLPDPKELPSGRGLVFRLAKLTEALSAEARTFLGSPNNTEQFRDRYDALRTAQQVLPSLAEQRYDYEPSGFTSMPFSVPVNLYVSNGVIGASGTFINALEGVHLDRIGRCAVCPNIFWKLRVNSECCTEKCRKRYNKQNSRAALKELRVLASRGRRGRRRGM